MNRRSLFQRLAALAAVSAVTKPAKAVQTATSMGSVDVAAQAPPTERVLRVRPQDFHEWLVRTQCATRLVSTDRGVEAVANTGVLRVNLTERKLYFGPENQHLPKIDRIEACGHLVSKCPKYWETEVVPVSPT